MSGQDLTLSLDIGSDFITVAGVENGKVCVVCDAWGMKRTPSVVGFTEEGVVFGHDAKNQEKRNPINTISRFVPLIGAKIDDSAVIAMQHHLNYNLVGTSNKNVLIEVQDQGKTRRVSPEKLLVMLLQEVVKDIPDVRKNGVVVVVSPHKGLWWMNRIQECVKEAGMTVIRIMDPVVGVITDHMVNGEWADDKEEGVFVVDCGASKTVGMWASVDQGIMEVKEDMGVEWGGNMVDDALVDLLALRLREEKGAEIKGNAKAMIRMRKEVEKAKKQITMGGKARIELYDILQGIDFFTWLTEEDVSGVVEPWIGTLKQFGFKKKDWWPDVGKLFLSGGNSNLKAVQNVFSELFPNATMVVDDSLCVAATGAAFYGVILNATDKKSISDMLLLCQTPSSLGIQCSDSKVVQICEKRIIPFKKFFNVTTTVDDQEVLHIPIVDGTTVTGMIDVHVQPAPAGMINVEIKLEAYADLRMVVTAEEKTFGGKLETSIDSVSRFEKAESNVTVMDSTTTLPISVSFHEAGGELIINECNGNVTFVVTITKKNGVSTYMGKGSLSQSQMESISEGSWYLENRAGESHLFWERESFAMKKVRLSSSSDNLGDGRFIFEELDWDEMDMEDYEDNDDINDDDTGMSSSSFQEPSTMSSSSLESSNSFLDNSDSFEIMQIDFADLEIGKVVGRGATAVVYRGEFLGEEVAIKEFLVVADERDQKQFERELRGLLFQHTHLVQFRGFSNDEAAHQCLVMEFCPNTLSQLIDSMESMPLSLIHRLATEIAKGMAFLHSRHVVHRDLKPDNVLLTKDQTVRITDFGLARTNTNTMSMTGGVGTWQFMAPELILDDEDSDEEEEGVEKKTRSVYSQSVDVYAFGMVLWAMMAGKKPFAKSKHSKHVVKIAKNPNLREKIEDGWNEQLVELMKECWATEPHDRPTFKEILAKLKRVHFEREGSVESDMMKDMMRKLEKMAFVQNEMKEMMED